MSIGSCFVCCVIFVVVVVAAVVVVGVFFFLVGFWFAGVDLRLRVSLLRNFRERETEVLGIGFLERVNIFFFLGSVCFCFRV